MAAASPLPANHASNGQSIRNSVASGSGGGDYEKRVEDDVETCSRPSSTSSKSQEEPRRLTPEAAADTSFERNGAPKTQRPPRPPRRFVGGYYNPRGGFIRGRRGGRGGRFINNNFEEFPKDLSSMGDGGDDASVNTQGQIFPPRRGGGRGRFFRGRPNARNLFSMPTVPLAALRFKDFEGMGDVIPYCPVHCPVFPLVDLGGGNSMVRRGGRGFPFGRGRATGSRKNAQAEQEAQSSGEPQSASEGEGDKSSAPRQQGDQVKEPAPKVSSKDDLSQKEKPEDKENAPLEQRNGKASKALMKKRVEDATQTKPIISKEDLEALMMFKKNFMANINTAQGLLAKLEKRGLLPA